MKKPLRCPRCQAYVRDEDLAQEPVYYALAFGGSAFGRICIACVDELVDGSKAPDPMPAPEKVVGWVKREVVRIIGRHVPRYRSYSYEFQLVGTVKKGKCVAADPGAGHPEHHWAIIRYKNWGHYRYCRWCFPRTGKLYRVNTDHDGRWDNLLYFTKAQRVLLGATA